MKTAMLLDDEELFEAVDRVRRRRGLTRAQVAAELGVSPASWSGWSSGRTPIGGDSALRISVFIDRDLRDFLKPAEPSPVTQADAA